MSTLKILAKRSEGGRCTVADGLADFRSKTNDSDLIYRGEVRRILQDQKVVHKERAVNRLTPANVAPVVKGEWQESPIGDYTIFYKCSVCNGYGHIWDDFCPNCGAAMTEEALKILARRSEGKKDE